MGLKPDNASMAARLGLGLSAEDQFACIAEASLTALVLAGPTGRIEMVNRQAERMFGYDRVELQNKPLESLIAERFRGRHVDLCEHFMADMSAGAMREGREMFGLRKNGTEFPLEIRLNPFEFAGEPMVLAGMIDITARREIEQEREQQRQNLVRSTADLEEFAYVAAHDLRAPLRAITHLVQWIREDIEATASPDTAENLKLLQGRVVRMQMLLEGLLAYSRVGHTHTAVENVDIVEMVREVVAMLAPPSSFVVTCDGTIAALRTHRLPFERVLENLIGNALKHHDRPEGHITITMRMVDGMAEFRVSDDGPGIPPQFHDRIFVLFQTLASRDDIESSGVGLAIVKKQVQAHGGQIRVESTPPARGTTFVFTWKEAAL